MEQKYTHLSLEERYQIARLHEDGQALRKIAASLDRSTSTISREINRNTPSKNNPYKPLYADEIAWARRWRGSKIERHPELLKLVLDRLAMGWSPEQIAGRMQRKQYNRSISHESIYRFIYAQIKRTQDYSWKHYLPRSKSKRGFRGRKGGSPVFHIPHRVGIAQRPKKVDHRNRFGDWEADLIMTSDKKHNVLVVQERRSRMTFLHWNTTKDSAHTAKTLLSKLQGLPKRLLRTMTFDNGTEFSRHHVLQEAFNLKTFFCDPRKPWQKGGVENMNGRIRRYLPLKTDPKEISQEYILDLQNRLNSTPRKCLGYQTPQEVFNKVLHFKCEFTKR